MSIKKTKHLESTENGIRWSVYSARMWIYECFIFSLLLNKLNRWQSVQKEVIIFIDY